MDDNWRSIGVLADCVIESAVFEWMKRGGADLGETSLNPALAAATLRPATVFEFGLKEAGTQRHVPASYREVLYAEKTPSAHREMATVSYPPAPDGELSRSAVVISLCVMVHAATCDCGAAMR